jgi:hypothetical protein
MSYGKRTEFFGIPIPCKKDKIEEIEETRRMNIIENQLLAASKGVKCAVFEEGIFEIKDNHDGTCSVSLYHNETTSALCGIVGGGYVEAKESIVWDNLKKGGIYYLYVSFTVDLFENETAFRVLSTLSPKTNNPAVLLMAIADLSNDKIELNTNPDGKIYGSDIALHTSDKTNPHGESLFQDELTVRKHLGVNIGEDDSLTEASITVDDKRTGKATIESKNEMVLQDKRTSVTLSDDINIKLVTANQTIIGAINEAFESKVFMFDTDSGGTGGILITVPNAEQIISVEAHLVVEATKGISKYSFPNIGQIAVGYYNLDRNVPDKTSLKLYNNGDIGIKIRVRILYR